MKNDISWQYISKFATKLKTWPYSGDTGKSKCFAMHRSMHTAAARPSKTPFCTKIRIQVKCVMYLLKRKVSHSWQEHWVHTVGNQPDCVKGNRVCSIVCAINLQLIFLGHLSAGNYLRCSNLSDYYVTDWPSSPYTLSLSVIFHLACMYCMHSMSCLWMQLELTGFEAGISRLKCSGCRWNSMKKRQANSVKV